MDKITPVFILIVVWKIAKKLLNDKCSKHIPAAISISKYFHQQILEDASFAQN